MLLGEHQVPMYCILVSISPNLYQDFMRYFQDSVPLQYDQASPMMEQLR